MPGIILSALIVSCGEAEGIWTGHILSMKISPAADICDTAAGKSVMYVRCPVSRNEKGIYYVSRSMCFAVSLTEVPGSH